MTRTRPNRRTVGTSHYNPSAVRLKRTIFRQAPPDSGGRHGTDIITYPDIYLEHDQAEFRFTKCLFVRVWDEFALSTQKPDPEPSQFEGRTFRRYIKSSLLGLHSHLPASGLPAPIHYQLNFPNEIIDIICHVAPIITVRSDRVPTGHVTAVRYWSYYAWPKYISCGSPERSNPKSPCSGELSLNVEIMAAAAKCKTRRELPTYR